MGKHIDKMVKEGVLDSESAKKLNDKVKKSIEDMDPRDIETIIKFHLSVSKDKAWEPDPDGSIF
jgi:hypothetical protein